MWWHTVTHGWGKWRGNWRMEWVASTLRSTLEHGVSSITTADAHTSAASSRLNWRPRRSKWTRPFRRKTKSGFCTCAITFQTQSTGGDLCGGKAAGVWLWPLTPSSAEVKNDCLYTSNPPPLSTWLYGAHRDGLSSWLRIGTGGWHLWVR